MKTFKFFDGKCANALFHVGFNKGADAALCVYSAAPADVDRCVRPAGLRKILNGGAYSALAFHKNHIGRLKNLTHKRQIRSGMWVSTECLPVEIS